MSHSDEIAAFGSAIESADFPAAQAAVDRFIASFQSRPRTPTEISAARDFLDSALDAATARRQILAKDLAKFTHLQTGYRRPHVSHTWRLDG